MSGRPEGIFGDQELVEQFAEDPEALAVLDAIAQTQTVETLEHHRLSRARTFASRLGGRNAGSDAAPKHHRRRVVPTALIAAAVLVTAAAASAVGLLRHYVDFGSSPSARGRVVREFSELPRVTASHGPGPLTGSAREVYAVPGSARIRLYVAPAGRGFCWGVTTLGGTCVTAHSPVVEPFYSGRPVKGQREPALIAGAVRGRPERLSLSFEDGSQTDLQLIYVSQPIAASFFIYEVPAHRWRPGTLPSEITVYGPGGHVEGHGRLMYETAG